MVKHIIALLVLSLIFGIIEKVFPGLRDQKKPLKEKLLDAFYFLISPIMNKVVVAMGVKIVLIIFVVVFGMQQLKETQGMGFGPILLLPVPIQIFATLFVGDFISYWVHRLFHTSKLWKIHAIHHSSTSLDWASSARVHPLNTIANRGIQAFALLSLGLPVKLLAIYVPFLTLYGIFLHANVNLSFGPFKYLIASPAFHRWHHTSQKEGMDKNFAGIFPIFDIVFGSFYLPQGHFPSEFGVFGAGPPLNFFKQMIYPFVKQKPS